MSGRKPGWIPKAEEFDDGEENELFENRKDRLIHNTIYRIIGYLGTVSIVFVMSLLAFIIFVFSGKYLGSIWSQAESPLILIGISLFGAGFLSSIGYTVHSLGKWLKRYLEGCWKRAIPPHSEHIHQESGNSLDGLDHILFGYESQVVESPDVSTDMSVHAVLNLILLVFIVLLLSTLVLGTVSQLGLGNDLSGMAGENGEIGVNSNVSVFAAFISVLLTSALGALTLGLFAFSNVWTDVVIFGMYVVLPSFVFLPIIENIKGLVQKHHIDNLGPETPRDRIIPATLSIIYIIFPIYVLTKIGGIVV